MFQKERIRSMHDKVPGSINTMTFGFGGGASTLTAMTMRDEIPDNIHRITKRGGEHK
jgi:hypothetical protein